MHTRSMFLRSMACVALTGCASTITAVADRPVTSDKYVFAKDSNKTQKVSGDRRFVRIYQKLDFETDGEGNVLYDKDKKQIPSKPWFICIEPHADAIGSKGASSAFAIADRGSMTDAVKTALLQTFERTQAADIVRRLPYVACEAFLNSPMEPSDKVSYQKRIDRIIDGSLEFLTLLKDKPETSPGDNVDADATLPTVPEIVRSDTAIKDAEAKKAKLDREIAEKETRKAALDKQIEELSAKVAIPRN
jgi:hypothetical protein